MLLSPAVSAGALEFLEPGPHFTFSKREQISQHDMFRGGGEKICQSFLSKMF